MPVLHLSNHRRILLVCACAVWLIGGFPTAALNAQETFPLHSIAVEGNSRYPDEVIVEASGLVLGSRVGRPDFEAATARIHGTGFFDAVRFRFAGTTVDGEAGYALTLKVQEIEILVPVRIDIPGTVEEDIWSLLSERAPLAGREMPSNPDAQSYYLSALEQIAKEKTGSPQKLTYAIEGGMGEPTVVVFRPESLLTVVGIELQGNSVVSTEAIQSTLGRVAIGQGYTEQMFRRYLDLNVKPLYETEGYLNVSFPNVSTERTPGSDTGIVSVQVKENHQYRLGGVTITGDGIDGERLAEIGQFPVGDVAYWDKVLESTRTVENELSRDGYLGATSRISRQLDDDNLTANVAVVLDRGPQFVFGSLRLEGLSPTARQVAKQQWRLESGQPMNRPYISDYLKAVARQLRGVTGASSTLEPRPGTNVVDVIIRFR